MEGVSSIEEQSQMILARLMKPAKDALKQSVREWILIRNETIAALEKIIELLHKTTKDVAISNAVGSSVGALGGIIGIGGLILAPFTAGVSLIPAIVGGVTAGLGAATSIGSSIAGLVIDSKQDAQVKMCIENDKKHSDKLQTVLECYQKTCQLVVNVTEQTVHPESGSYKASDTDTADPRLGCNAARMVVTGIATGGTVGASKIGSSAARMATSGAVAGAKVAVAAAHALVVVGFALDVAMIAYNGVKLRNGAKSDMGTKLEEAVKELKDERDKYIKEYLDDPSD